MAAEITKRPLILGQFVWTVSRKNSKFVVYIGPDPLELTEDDIPVMPDRDDPTKIIFVDSLMAAIQNFVSLRPGQYAVVLNPASSATDEYPNAPYSSGRNDMKALVYGQKRVIMSGSFPVWPGQKVEVRNVHILSSSQYLTAVVESADVDSKAPHYDLTVRCALIKQAVVETKREREDGPTEELENVLVSGAQPVQEPYKFKVGQRIIIPGNLTPTFIPPSGIEVVIDDDVSVDIAMAKRGPASTAKTDRAVREAVVLGPTEFCVLLKEDGELQTQPGSGRVFPGPFDRFRTDGSRNRVYDAYHLRTDRGLLLRVVADRISKTNLAKQLPEDCVLEKEEYTKGDEIFVGGFDAYLVPSSAIEVINPETREPHVGNDHSKIYVKAIGVDQKSGVYVAKVETGNVALVPGEKKLLLDPRVERHVRRKVPGRMWNLMIGAGEPHKRVHEDDMVDTPWALSIIIPNNEAVLITSKSGRTVAVGPCMKLLEYEEQLEVLTLSKGRPKSDADQLETCFLRVTGNQVTDKIRLETFDNVPLDVVVSYGVEFVGETPEDRIKWFNHKDYVLFLCEHLRSRLCAEARKHNISEIYKPIADFVRDTILGKKPESEGQHRPGSLFGENNMKVIEVEVLYAEVLNRDVAVAMQRAAQTVVVREIEDQTRKVELMSDELRDQIAAKQASLAQVALKRTEEAGIALAESANRQETKKFELAHALEEMRQKKKLALENAIAMLRDGISILLRKTQREDEEQRLMLDDKDKQLIVEFRKNLAEIEKGLVKAAADADVARLNAIQDKLVEALEGLGNKELLTTLAQNLPKAGGSVGLLAGLGGITALKQMVRGTRFETALNALADTAEDLKSDGERLAGNPGSNPGLSR